MTEPIMIDPSTTCVRLASTPDEILHLVNTGTLAAYDFDGSIRFRSADVAALMSAYCKRSA